MFLSVNNFGFPECKPTWVSIKAWAKKHSKKHGSSPVSEVHKPFGAQFSDKPRWKYTWEFLCKWPGVNPSARDNYHPAHGRSNEYIGPRVWYHNFQFWNVFHNPLTRGNTFEPDYKNPACLSSLFCSHWVATGRNSKALSGSFALPRGLRRQKGGPRDLDGSWVSTSDGAGYMEIVDVSISSPRYFDVTLRHPVYVRHLASPKFSTIRAFPVSWVHDPAFLSDVCLNIGKRHWPASHWFWASRPGASKRPPP